MSRVTGYLSNGTLSLNQLYSYLSNDANHYLPTEDDLIYLSIGEATEKAKNIDTTMVLKLNLLFFPYKKN